MQKNILLTINIQKTYKKHTTFFDWVENVHIKPIKGKMVIYNNRVDKIQILLGYLYQCWERVQVLSTRVQVQVLLF